MVVGEINEEKGLETVNLIKELGGEALLVEMDVRLPEDAKRLTESQ